MTKSTITREQAQKIIVAADEVISALAGTNEDVHPDDSKKMCELWDDLNDRHAPPVVVRELARMALAAMDALDSETVISDCDPEVFEKGASACLVAIPKEDAEVICKGITAATGCKVDWHYFGGRVHIKALRPASMVSSDPVYQYRIRNGYNGLVTEWQTIRRDQVDFVIKAQPLNAEFQIIAAPQPAPVVPDDVLDALQKVARIRLDMNDFDGDRRGIADCLCDAEEALIEVVNRRAAMLAAATQEVKP